MTSPLNRLTLFLEFPKDQFFLQLTSESIHDLPLPLANHKMMAHSYADLTVTSQDPDTSVAKTKNVAPLYSTPVQHCSPRTECLHLYSILQSLFLGPNRQESSLHPSVTLSRQSLLLKDVSAI